MGHNINYDASAFPSRPFEYSFVVILPEIYVDSILIYYWQHRDIDLIEESLGILLERI